VTYQHLKNINTKTEP